MRRNAVIKYAIFILGLILILLFIVSQGRKVDINSLSDYESAKLTSNLGQSLLWMWIGWGAIYFSIIGIYNAFKKKANP
jgi:hypothetical protein